MAQKFIRLAELLRNVAELLVNSEKLLRNAG